MLNPDMDPHIELNNPTANQHPPADGPSVPIKKFGCSGCLFLALGALLLGYIVVFQTSIPVKLIARSIAKSTQIVDRPLVIKGVGGSLSRGISIKTLIIPGEAGDTTITGLKFKYKKPIRWFTRGQVTITEVSCTSAEFIVANDFLTSDEESDETADGEIQGEAETTGDKQTLVAGNGFFDLHLLKFQNTRIRTADDSIDVNIPLIYLKDLHIDQDDFEIAELKVDSNMLTVALADGKTADIDGQGVSFDQQLNIVIKPKIHDAVIKEIPVSVEFGKDKGQSTTRITAFDGAFEQVNLPNGKSLVRIQSLNAQDYLAFDKHVLPSQLKLTAREQDKLVELEAGSFNIGQTTFTYPQQQFENIEGEDEAIAAKATVGPYEVTALLKPNNSEKAWPPVQVELSSQPEAPKKEILAQLYYGKSYGSLSAEEKASIDSIQ